MKKKISLILLIGLVIASCMDEISSLYTRSAEVDFSIDEAKSAFERNAKSLEIRPLTTNPGTRNGKKTPVITPLWQKGEIYSNEDGVFANVPFNIPLVKVFGRKKTDETLLSDDEKYSNTDIRLLVQKTQENEYIYTVVYITGDFSYVIDKHKKVKSLRLDKLDAFSGEIRYFTLEGNLLWGEIYKDGKKIGTISVADSSAGGNAGKVQTRSYVTVCEPHLMEYETCYHYGYDMGEGYVENGVDCFYDYVVEYYCYDEWVEDETGCPLCGSPYCNGECQYEGGDNTGQQKPAKKVNKVHTSKDTDVISDKSLLEMKRKAQRGNTCVPTIMEYVLKSRDNNVDRKDIIKYLEDKLSTDNMKYKVKEQGTPTKEIPNLVMKFVGEESIKSVRYGGDPPYDYKAAIDRGNVVMTNIVIEYGGNKIGHNLLIVGYTQENNYIYIDPNDKDNVYECSPDYLEHKKGWKYDFEFKK